jgi:hypothetical protein
MAWVVERIISDRERARERERGGEGERERGTSQVEREREREFERKRYVSEKAGIKPDKQERRETLARARRSKEAGSCRLFNKEW